MHVLKEDYSNLAVYSICFIFLFLFQFEAYLAQAAFVI